jgi:hypothetical protein
MGPSEIKTRRKRKPVHFYGHFDEAMAVHEDRR